MTKQIYYLAGKGNCGKTDTVKRTYQEILNLYPNAKIIIEEINGVELFAVLEINRRIVGVSSQGDAEEFVLKHLKRLISEGSEIIITATRSRGGSENAVKLFKPPYAIFKINQTYESIAINQPTSNQTMALLLANKVKSAINA